MRIRFFGQLLPWSLLSLWLAELAVVTAAPVLALRLLDGSHATGHAGAITGLFAAFAAVALLTLGLFNPRQRDRTAGLLLRISAVVVVAAVAARIACELLAVRVGTPRLFTLTALLAWAGLAALMVAARPLLDRDILRRRVLVYGAGQRAQHIARLRRRADRRGFRLVGYVPRAGEACLVPAGQVLQPPDSLRDYCFAHEIDEVVVALDERRRSLPMRELIDCRLAGIDVTEVATFLERETGRIHLGVLSPSWIIFGEGFGREPLWRAVGRLFDLLASLVLLVLTLPLMLLTVLAIWVEDGPRAPVLFRQPRVGLNDSVFQILKFRSMRVGAIDEDDGGRWACAGDTRVTRVGSWIRRRRIDELPQLINVLRGDMSLVGPRPEQPEYVARLATEIPYYRERHCVRPGITGWAQLSYPYGASQRDAEEKLQYDLYYIKHQSLFFDILLLLQTVEVVLFHKGAR
ncbi:MAG: TIGR03013 family PEP-CTERM/XrtA system glycosyltransferase [Gammaproteobacteria bacterium]|nr:TIGR03013 family PEP-CTERM/XrtA system glycosyltransferase [Gammaproteobacteria bacterium]